VFISAKGLARFVFQAHGGVDVVGTPWIKNSRHPDQDPKVQLIADLTGKKPEAVYCAVMRWFFWVDRHVEQGVTSISRRAFRDETRWRDDSLAEAMMDKRVDWLEEREGRLWPTRLDEHFTQSAKVRALTGKRVARHREAKRNAKCNAGGNADCNAPPLQERKPDPDPEKEEDKTPTQFVSVAQIGEAAEVARAVKTLKVSALVRGRVGGLDGLTVKEITDTYAAVKAAQADPDTVPPIGDVDAVVAARLLAARGQSMPSKKAGNLAAPLSGSLGRIADLRRNRLGRSA